MKVGRSECGRKGWWSKAEILLWEESDWEKFDYEQLIVGGSECVSKDETLL